MVRDYVRRVTAKYRYCVGALRVGQQFAIMSSKDYFCKICLYSVGL